MAYWTIAPTTQPTLLPQTTYSIWMNNITNTSFNIPMATSTILMPYGTLGTFEFSFVVFLLLFGYYVSMWLEQKNLRIALIVGIMFACLFALGGGLNISLPPLVYPIIYGAVAASLAGYILGTFKNV